MFAVGAAAVLLVVRAVLSAWLVVGASHEWLIGHLPDDAFYYFEIGSRLARGDGATFDGLHATNGFHPLWQGLIAALGLGFHGDALVRAALLMELALLLGAVALVGQLVLRRLGAWPAVGVLLVGAAPGVLIGGLDGMESGLSVFTLALVAALLERYARRGGRRDALLLGACCGLAVLARLDVAAVIWLVPAALVVRERRWRRAVDVAVVAFTVVVPYVVWNLITFGHLLSVSGTRKLQMMDASVASTYGSRVSASYFDLVASHVQALVDQIDQLANPVSGMPAHLVTLVSLLALLGWAIARVRHGGASAVPEGRPARSSAGGFAMAVVALLIVLKTLANLVLLPPWSTGWYAAPARFFGVTAVVVAAIVGWRALVGMLRTPGVRQAVAAGGAALAVLALAASPFVHPGSSRSHRQSGLQWQIAIDQTAGWIARDHPQGRYGAYDAGLLGYELDPTPVVNLDGLVNDYHYDRLVSDPMVPPVDRYHDEGVTLLIGRFARGDDRLPTCATLLWSSPEVVSYTNDLTGQVSRAPVGVYDLRACS